MQKNQWLNIIQKINDGNKVDYIVLANGTKLFSQYTFKKRIFKDKKFTGKYKDVTSKYWVSVSGDAIYMNYPARSGYYDYTFNGISIFNIKFVKFK